MLSGTNVKNLEFHCMFHEIEDLRKIRAYGMLWKLAHVKTTGVKPSHE